MTQSTTNYRLVTHECMSPPIIGINRFILHGVGWLRGVFVFLTADQVSSDTKFSLGLGFMDVATMEALYVPLEGLIPSHVIPMASVTSLESLFTMDDRTKCLLLAQVLVELIDEAEITFDSDANTIKVSLEIRGCEPVSNTITLNPGEGLGEFRSFLTKAQNNPA